jgi:hypothetical protein
MEGIVLEKEPSTRIIPVIVEQFDYTHNLHNVYGLILYSLYLSLGCPVPD